MPGDKGGRVVFIGNIPYGKISFGSSFHRTANTRVRGDRGTHHRHSE